MNSYLHSNQNGRTSVPAVAATNQKRSFYRLSLRSALALTVLLGSMVLVQIASAQSLQGNGVLPLPANCSGNGTTGPGCGPDLPAILPSITGNGTSFTGQFPGYAGSGYGSFTGSGPYPGYVGSNTFDFSTMPNNVLPMGSVVILGDLDKGSTEYESFTFTAYDKLGQQITTPWLNNPFYMYSANNGDLYAQYMPEFDFNASTGVYLFDGENVPDNPTVGVYLNTNVDIGFLNVVGTSSFAGFGIGAPTPEPGSLLLLGSGVVGIAGIVRRRFIR